MASIEWMNAPSPAVALEQAKTARAQFLNLEFESWIDEAMSEYSLSERLSFAKQEQQARDYKSWEQAGMPAGMEPSVPFIEALAAERGLSLSVIADKIMAKVAISEQFLGTAVGRLQALTDTMKAIALEDHPSLDEAINAVNATEWTGV